MAKRRRRRRSTAKRGPGGRFVKRSHAAAPKRHRRRRRVSGGKRRPAMGYVVGSRRVRRLKLNPRHRRRHRRHNPRLFTMGGITSALTPALWGAVGGVAFDIAFGYVPLPAMVKTGYPKHAAKIAGALALGWAAKKFMRGRGSQMAQGMLVIAMYGLVKDVAKQFLPAQISSKLGDYEEVQVSSYNDLGAQDMGAYIEGPVEDAMGADDLGYTDAGSPLSAYLEV